MSIKAFDDGWTAALWFVAKTVKNKKDNFEHLSMDQLIEMLMIELGEVEVPEFKEDLNAR